MTGRMMTRCLAGLIMAAGLSTAVGCKHDEATAPPGPGPTALPQSYNGRDVPPAGPINTESRMGSERSSGTSTP